MSTITAGCMALASTTALALPNIGAMPAPATDSTQSVRVLKSGSLVDDEGRQISYEVWIDGGVIYGDARIDDDDGNHLELWREGDVIHYEGVMDGQTATGENPAGVDINTQPQKCVGWLFLVCLGALFLNSGGCAHEDKTSGGCVPEKGPTDVPGGQGGAPEEPGDGDGDDEPPPPPGGGDPD